MIRLKLIGVGLLFCLLQIPVRAGEIVWVGPGDTPGEGTRDKPYTFTQAFSGSVHIQPGSTVQLLDGFYKPTFSNTVKETSLATPKVGSSRVDLQACKLEYSIVSPK